MNKSGAGLVGVIFLFIMFLIIWFVWLSSWINETGNIMITTNNLVGVEAFFYANLNVWVFIGAILGMLGFVYFGGSSR